MTTQSEQSGYSRLYRLVVNLTPRANRALRETAELTDRSKTDTFNRAMIVGGWVDQKVAAGATFYVGMPRRGLMRLAARLGLSAPERIQRFKIT